MIYSFVFPPLTEVIFSMLNRDLKLTRKQIVFDSPVLGIEFRFGFSKRLAFGFSSIRKIGSIAFTISCPYFGIIFLKKQLPH